MARNTGLKDKNGNFIYDNHRLRCKFYMGSQKEWVHEGIYKVNEINYKGFSLTLESLTDNVENNQVPISGSPSFYNRVLCIDNRNGNYDSLAFADTYSSNDMYRTRWQENHYSNDVEIINP